MTKNNPSRALKLLKGMPDFQPAQVRFVSDESFKEGGNILNEKDINRKEFNIETFQRFSYKEQLGTMRTINLFLPLLLLTNRNLKKSHKLLPRLKRQIEWRMKNGLR